MDKALEDGKGDNGICTGAVGTREGHWPWDQRSSTPDSED